MIRPIAISLSPNSQTDDVLLAIKMLFSPRKWQDNNEVVALEEQFGKKFGGRCLAVNSGRVAQYLILKALGLKAEDEVIIQAFTCSVVPNSILWLKAKPVFVDIDDQFNIDINDLKKKITSHTKVIITQNTFGISANVVEIRKIAWKNNLILIEDCCHSMGAKRSGQYIGTFGKASFFSFGRDKVLSSVYGGMILCQDEKFYQRLKRERDALDRPKIAWVVQQLLHPIIFNFLVLPFYNLYLGKLILKLGQKIGLLSKAVYPQEKESLRPAVFPKKMPGALAVLARNQLKKLDKYNQLRQQVAERYSGELSSLGLSLPKFDSQAVWLRYPIIVDDSDKLLKQAKAQGILLGDWYKPVVASIKSLKTVGYQLGSCPRAEQLSCGVVNLPTYPLLTNSEVDLLIKNMKVWLTTK